MTAAQVAHDDQPIEVDLLLQQAHLLPMHLSCDIIAATCPQHAPLKQRPNSELTVINAQLKTFDMFSIR